jgi:hypothetical protein
LQKKSKFENAPIANSKQLSFLSLVYPLSPYIAVPKASQKTLPLVKSAMRRRRRKRMKRVPYR